MGLPCHILNKIINFVLPIYPHRQQQNSLARTSDHGENFKGPFFHCTYIHPILWTCRQLRYEYGQRFCTYRSPSPTRANTEIPNLLPHPEFASKAD